MACCRRGTRLPAGNRGTDPFRVGVRGRDRPPPPDGAPAPPVVSAPPTGTTSHNRPATWPKTACATSGTDRTRPTCTSGTLWQRHNSATPTVPTAAISQGRDAREREHTDDMLEIGGEFTISLASHMRDIGTALTDIEGADQEATAELERAVAAYEAGPGPAEQHWFAGRPLASIDLASIQLRSGALDAAAATLAPVLLLPPRSGSTRCTNRLRWCGPSCTGPFTAGRRPRRTWTGRSRNSARTPCLPGCTLCPAPRSKRSPAVNGARCHRSPRRDGRHPAFDRPAEQAHSAVTASVPNAVTASAPNMASGTGGGAPMPGAGGRGRVSRSGLVSRGGGRRRRRSTPVQFPRAGRRAVRAPQRDLDQARLDEVPAVEERGDLGVGAQR